MAAAQTNPNLYQTVADVNNRLDQLGFQQLDAMQAEKIRNTVPRDRFVRALEMASTDLGAWNFLGSLINRKERANTVQATSTMKPGNNVYRMDNTASSPNTTAPAPQANRPARNAPTDDLSQADKHYISHHVYGSKAALCWQVDTTRKGEPTICLEAAGAVGDRKYDWNNKITIQLTRDELPCVAATFLGIITETKGTNHGVGDNKGKGFEIQHQGDKLFVRVFAPGKQMPVPVSPYDAFSVVSLLLRQLKESKPWMDTTDIINALRCVHGRMLQNQNK